MTIDISKLRRLTLVTENRLYKKRKGPTPARYETIRKSLAGVLGPNATPTDIDWFANYIYVHAEFGISLPGGRRAFAKQMPDASFVVMTTNRNGNGYTDISPHKGGDFGGWPNGEMVDMIKRLEGKLEG